MTLPAPLLTPSCDRLGLPALSDLPDAAGDITHRRNQRDAESVSCAPSCATKFVMETSVLAYSRSAMCRARTKWPGHRAPFRATSSSLSYSKDLYLESTHQHIVHHEDRPLIYADKPHELISAGVPNRGQALSPASDWAACRYQQPYLILDRLSCLQPHTRQPWRCVLQLVISRFLKRYGIVTGRDTVCHAVSPAWPEMQIPVSLRRVVGCIELVDVACIMVLSGT